MESTVRIIVTPSSTRLPPETKDSVVVSGSHAAIFTVYLSARAGARAAIQHDAGIGLDQAGVSGLAWAEKLGMAVAAVAANSARIGDGDDMMRRGVLSRVNGIAAACGVKAGMTCRDAADRLREGVVELRWPHHVWTQSFETFSPTSQLVVVPDAAPEQAPAAP